MHFHYEVVNKKCRFCGPGSSKDPSRQMQMAVSAPAQGGVPTISHGQNGNNQNAQGGFPPLPQGSGNPYQALMEKNGPSQVEVSKTEKGPIDPNVIANQMKMFGAEGQCSFCFLSTRGFNVDVEVVNHAPECQQKGS